ncbi:MAG: hypothetical protein JWN76_1671 [Chitinophagaceae bacterium]|nr:hypothetical protein [Chitinophagaceae bacterium]
MKSTSSHLKQLVDELNNLIKDFRYEEALDKFYDENVVSCENDKPPIVGLAAYKERAKIFLPEVSNYSAQLLNVIVSDDISATEWHYKFDNTLTGPWDCSQISVQRWKNGKIVHERHNYKTMVSG